MRRLKGCLCRVGQKKMLLLTGGINIEIENGIKCEGCVKENNYYKKEKGE